MLASLASLLGYLVTMSALAIGCTGDDAGHPRRSSLPAIGSHHARSEAVSSAPAPLAGVSVPLPSTSATPAETPPQVRSAPSELVKLLSTKPYVEESCRPADDARFGAAAKRCRYEVMGVAAEVLVANPDAERVARWIVDAAGYVAPLEAVRESDPGAWQRGVVALGRHVRQQSSRIFPIHGEIVEDLGAGPRAFRFDRGVVTPCDKGSCRCRINSLTPGAFCAYLEATGGDRAACAAKYQGAGTAEAWRQACVDNHVRAMNADHNDHFRAKALLVGRAVEKRCARGCAPALVVVHLEKELGL